VSMTRRAQSARLSVKEHKDIACTETMRWILMDFDNRLNAAWTTKTLLRATVETDADVEMALLLAGGLLRSSSRPTLNLLLPSARQYERGAIEKKLWIDVASPPPPPRVCMCIFPEGECRSYQSECLFSMTLLPGLALLPLPRHLFRNQPDQGHRPG